MEAACVYVQGLRVRLRARRNGTRVLFVVLCLGCTLAVGQGSPSGSTSTTQATSPADAKPVPFTAEEMPVRISFKVMSKLAALRSNSQLLTAGDTITAFFLVLLLVWSSVKTMAGGKGLGELFGAWVPIFVSFGIVSLFLDRTAGDLIVNTMDKIGEAIAGRNMATLESAIHAGTTPIFKGIAAVISQPSISESTRSSGGGMFGWLGHITLSAASGLMGIGAKTVAVFLLVVAGVVTAAHIIMGFISVQLVLALAPVMVPFLMFKPMEWMFNSWLKFLMSACMLKIVLAFLLSVAAALLEGVSELAQEARNDAWKATETDAFFADILLIGMTVAFALIASLLISQGPRIADGLLAGSASAGGFAGIQSITHGTAVRAVESMRPKRPRPSKKDDPPHPTNA